MPVIGAGKENHLQAVSIASEYGSERFREVLDFASVFVVTSVRNALVGLSYESLICGNSKIRKTLQSVGLSAATAQIPYIPRHIHTSLLILSIRLAFGLGLRAFRAGSALVNVLTQSRSPGRSM